MNTTCAISGGGPAGMMLALLLARNGIDVVVLEKHADFFRDFRGDTIPPSTIGVLGELGLRDAFLGLPHTSIRTLDAVVDGTRLHPIDFGRLRPPDDFLVLAPQWDFLTFLAEQGERSPSFHLRMSTEATGLIWEDGEVRGLTAEGPEGPIRIQADPRKLTFIRHIVPGTQEVTAADVQRAANLVLKDSKAFRLEVEPQKVAQAQTEGGAKTAAMKGAAAAATP